MTCRNRKRDDAANERSTRFGGPSRYCTLPANVAGRDGLTGIHSSDGHAVKKKSNDKSRSPFEVVGIITPVAGEYETEAEAVKAMRQQAAKRGADALYIESMSESGGWKFGSGFGGVSGGSFSELRFRAKAIVWR